ncbi:hypothetical protein O0I10_000774 [Lichtheimia ornata]|uniref:FHA domain-containing protein n=1 Tax=Lichtheimia ornata TaxID=688661 RepID=A0AAD7Y4C7_9FUNG|nr:uncharacterized protein O0I10_000774 [Lichtheimia ornata]KAJ8663531.1 hypothetical protein O0I10_000774 [Lichtheimia ornata]
MENQASPWSSPTRAPFQEVNQCYMAPDSPVEKQQHFSSDDLVDTSRLNPNDEENYEEEQQRVDVVFQQRPTKQPIILLGGTEPITIGRGSDATIKIGKRNRQISRIHARIEFKSDINRYEFIVVGLNGAMVDNVIYRQHERIELEDGANINILGSKITFMYPDLGMLFPDNNNNNNNKELHHQQRPLSPPPFEEKEHVVEQKPVMDDDVKEEEAVSTNKNENIESTEDVVACEQKDVDIVNTTPPPQLPASSPVDVDMKKEEQEEEEKPQLNEKRKVEQVDIEENKENEENNENDGIDFAEIIIDALVFSRKSSMPISDICSRIMSTHPMYRSQPREMWKERIQKVLKEKPFFGEIVRKGKTADGSPKENLYYYNSEADPVEWRRAEYTHVGRSARKCTLQDKQYFWKIPPKLGRNRHSYVPPPSKAYEQEKREAKKQKTPMAALTNKTNA